MKSLLLLWLFTISVLAAEKPMQAVIEGKKTLKLEHAKTLEMKSRQGEVLRLKVIEPPSKKMNEKESQAVAKFQWEYERTSDQFRTNGAGVYVEKYFMNKQSDGSYKLTDAGSNILFKQGEFVVQWSFGSADYSWFYYNSEKFSHRAIVSGSKEK